MLLHERKPFVFPERHRHDAAEGGTRPIEPCDLCGVAVARTFEAKGYRFFDCPACDYAFLARDVRLSLRTGDLFNDGYFNGGGAGYNDYLEEHRLLRDHGARYASLLHGFHVGKRVLDAGAAAGFVLRGLIDGGFDGTGVEPNATMARFGRDRLQLDVRCAGMETFESDERFDCIAMIQVVDHFADIEAALTNAAYVTKPGGHWLVEFGNRASVTARILGPLWHEYAPPTVLRAFSRRSMCIAARRHGFELIAHGRAEKRIGAAHAKSLMRYLAGTSTLAKIATQALGVIPDRLSLPYPADDIMWALFRNERTASA